jgi:hypothetical protein
VAVHPQQHLVQVVLATQSERGGYEQTCSETVQHTAEHM